MCVPAANGVLYSNFLDMIEFSSMLHNTQVYILYVLENLKNADKYIHYFSLDK